MLNEFFSLFNNQVFGKALHFIWKLWPLWLPILLARGAFHLWMDYKKREWIKAQGSVLLEIFLPTEILKSPVSMEVFLQALHQTSVGTVSDVFFKGRVRQWFSLELVSDGGKIHFYIWMHAGAKKGVETQLYALFPNVEVKEVKDYALSMRHDIVKYKFGRLGNIVLTKDDVYPIKTYIDYGLDQDPKEEYKHDPMAPMLEYLGSLKPGEHAWIQILVQGHAKETFKYGRLINRPDWSTRATEAIKKILKEAKFKPAETKESEAKHLSEEQKDIIKAIERSISKSAFDTMIRAFYFAEVDKFNPVNIGGLLGAFKSFSSNSLNGFKPGKGASSDYPWQDFGGLLKNASERDFLEAYKRRAYFNPPSFRRIIDKSYVLTTEELATLYHFPSAVAVATPTLTRIPSKKAEAPANLPI